MNARLWDTELYDLLNQLAYERAHHAGREEVEAELTGLLNDFVSINERLKKGKRQGSNGGSET